MLTSRTIKRLISTLLLLVITLASSITSIGTYNGNSNSTYSQGTSGLVWGSNDVNQGLRFTLLFLENESIGTMEKEQRDNLWKQESLKIIQIGKVVDVYRSDTQDIGTRFIQQSIFKNDFMEEERGVGRTGLDSSNISRFSIPASEIGLDDYNYPKPINMSNRNPGKSTLDYFMLPNPKFTDDGTESEWLVGEEMKKVIHYVSNPDTKGKFNTENKDIVSFISEEGSQSFNSASVFDKGLYQGRLGEYKLLIEPFYVASKEGIGSVALSLRDGVWYNSEVDNSLFNSQGLRFRQIANDIKLTSSDMFNLQNPTTTITNNTQLSELSKTHGYGLNILSSELFRSTAKRAMASQTTSIILSDGTLRSGTVGYIGGTGSNFKTANAVVDTVEKTLNTMIKIMLENPKYKSLSESEKQHIENLTDEQFQRLLDLYVLNIDRISNKIIGVGSEGVESENLKINQSNSVAVLLALFSKDINEEVTGDSAVFKENLSTLKFIMQDMLTSEANKDSLEYGLKDVRGRLKVLVLDTLLSIKKSDYGSKLPLIVTDRLLKSSESSGKQSGNTYTFDVSDAGKLETALNKVGLAGIPIVSSNRI